MGLWIQGIVVNDDALIGEDEDTMYVASFSKRSLLDSEVRSICYDEPNYTEVSNGFGMSYGSYNGFRSFISMIALGKTARAVWEEARELDDTEPYPNALFHLINFSDCEGYIGPTAVKELDEYFDIHSDKIKKAIVEQEDEEDYYSSRFDQLVACVKETAKHSGYLDFG